MRWRFVDSGALDGAEQMALDAGLMDRARERGEAVLRVYAWSRPTLSFGRHEGVRGRFTPEALARAGVGAVRRPTGGRVVLHDREVTYSVTAPGGEPDEGAALYRWVNALLVDALATLGVRAEHAAPVPARRPGGAACFAEPSPGELVVDGRKLVGSAQLRERGAVLQHGSILVDDDQARIADLATAPMTPAVPAATLRAVAGRAPAYDEVSAALAASLRARVGAADVMPPGELDGFAAPHRARFLAPEWTWRR